MNDFLQSLRNGQAEKARTPKTRKNYDNSYHYTSQPRFHSYGGYANTRNQQMKRPPQSQPAPQGNQTPAIDDTTVTSMLAEAIEGLSRHIETLAKNQDYLVTVHERTADMLERQAIAIEKIVDYLNIDSISEEETPGGLEHHYVSSAAPDAEESTLKENQQDITVKKAQAVENEKPAAPVIRRRKKIVSQQPKATAPTTTELMSREAIMDIIHTMRSQGATYDQVASRLIELGQPTFSGRGEWHAQTIHRLCSKK